MATSQLGWKVLLYMPRSAGETTPLTPVAGAPHDEAFAVSTLRGVEDLDEDGVTVLRSYRPYLDTVRGKRGTLNLKERRVDAGEVVLRLLDKKLDPGANAQRWVSAFFGDTGGAARHHGLLCRIWQTRDGGATWDAWWTGRVTRARTNGGAILELTVRDLSDDLDTKIFVGLPHASITYAHQQSLAPVGRTDPYGNLETVGWLRGAIGVGGVLRHVDHKLRLAGFYKALADLADEVRPSAQSLTTRFLDATFDGTKLIAEAYPVGSPGTLRRFVVRRIRAGYRGRTTDLLYRIEQGFVELVDPADPFYGASFDEGTDVRWRVLPTRGPIKGAPLYLNGVHLVRLFRHLLEGKFGHLAADGTPLLTVPYDEDAFDAMELDSTWPTIRGLIEAPANLLDFAEDWLFKLGLSYRFDGDGRVVPVDLRLVNALTPAFALTEDDLAEEDNAFDWETQQKDAIATVEGEYGVDTAIDPIEEKLGRMGAVPDLPPSMLQSATVPYYLVDNEDGTRDANGKAVALKAPGLRATVSLKKVSDGKAAAEGALRAAMLDLQTPFARGSTSKTTRHPWAVCEGIEPGTFGTVDFDQTPNPATHERGGLRTVLCLGRSEEGAVVELAWLDLGTLTQLEAPTVGALALGAETQHQLDVPLTPNAGGDTMLLEVAEIPATLGYVNGAEVPAEYWRAVGIYDGAQTVTVDVASDRRAFARAASVPTGGARGVVRSEWAYPTDADYLTTTAYTAPSGLALSAITSGGATATWTNNAPTLDVQVLVATGLGVADWSNDDVVATLPAGSTLHVLVGLAAGDYTVGIRCIDPFGVPTAVTAADLTLEGTGAVTPDQAPRPAGLAVVVPSAITLQLFASNTAFDLVLERAADDGTGTAPDVGTLERLDPVPGTTTQYQDPQAITGDTWWYRLLHVADGYTDSDPTRWVAAVAQLASTGGGGGAQEDGPEVPAILPTVTPVPSQTSTTATLRLSIDDPQGRLVDVAFKHREGADGVETAYAVDAAAPYEDSVPLVSGQESTVTGRVRYYGADGALVTDEYPQSFTRSALDLTGAAFVDLDDDATVTWATGGRLLNNARVTLGGNRTLDITDAVDGATGVLIVTQDGTGSRTLTLPDLEEGGALTLSTAAGAVDVLAWIYDGTSFYWTLGKGFA